MSKSKRHAKHFSHAQGKKEDHKKLEHKKPERKKQPVIENVMSQKAEKHMEVSFFMSLKNKLASLCLIALALLVIVFLGIFFWAKLMEPARVETLLPKDATVFFAQLNLGSPWSRSAANKKIENFLAQDVIDLESMKDTIEGLLGVDFNTDIAPWLGFSNAYAYMQLPASEGVNYAHLFFIQSTDKERTMETLRKLKLASQKDAIEEGEYEGYRYYYFSVGQNIYFMLWDDYFVFAQSVDALKILVDVRSGKMEALADDEAFIKVRNNLTRGVGFVYENPVLLLDAFTKGDANPWLSLMRPVVQMFSVGGHSLILEENALTAQSYFNFVNQRDGKTLPKLKEPYRMKLLEEVPADFEYFWGSRDISKMLNDFGVVLKELHPSSFNILEGAINAKKEEYFGYEVDLRNDIYPLFANEFALAMYAKPDRVDYLFIAEKQNAEHIAKLQAYYLAHMTEKGYEVIAQEGETASLPLSGTGSAVLATFPFSGRANMYTAMKGELFVAGTDRARVLQVAGGDGEASVSREGIRPAVTIKSFDEINIMSPAFMAELLPESIGKYLRGFSRIQASKSIFPDGISVVHVFEF